MYLIDVLHKVPIHLIPCLEGRPPAGTPALMLAGYFGSIFPAVWSFQLAARSRGLGTVLTTLHLIHEKEAAEILGIPDNVDAGRAAAGGVYERHGLQARRTAAGLEHHALEHVVK